MARINSKGKGNAFERNISDALSLWLTDGAAKRACWRSDTSGAAATVLAKKGQEERYVKANAGDIRQVEQKGIYPKLDVFFDTFVVECKAYKEIDFYPPYNGNLAMFFEACLREKATTGKKAVLILKANSRKILYLQERDVDHPVASVMTVYYKDLIMDVCLFDTLIKKSNDC